MIKALIVTLFILSTLTLLQVQSPTCWVNKMPDPIPYTISNFAQIPFAETIRGQIVLPKNPELCNTENQPQFNRRNDDTQNVVLIKRGGCNFDQKVINGEKLGANLVIVYDNKEGDSPKIIMKDSGKGDLTSVPSLFISNADGLNLQTGDNDCDGLPIVKVSFEQVKAETSQITLWLDVGDRKGYILAQEFYENNYFTILQGKIKIKLRFKIQSFCLKGKCGEREDCVGNNNQQYCISSDKNPRGQDIIRQSLRQYFLWEQLSQFKPSAWWQYMAKFDHNICFSQKIQSCSHLTMQQVGLSQEQIENVTIKVNSTIEAVQKSQDSILRTFAKQAIKSNIYYYPMAILNGEKVEGRLKAPELFAVICTSLINPPSQCTQVNQEQDIEILQENVLVRILLILGFDKDKTILVQRLKEIIESEVGSKHQGQQTANSTVAMNRIAFRIQNSHQESMTKPWINYVSDIGGIIYLVDLSDIEGLEKSRMELKDILYIKELEKIPILVLGNHFDKDGAVSEKQLLEKLELEPKTQLTKEVRLLKLKMCSVKNKKGYVQGFKWLVDFLK